MKNIVTRVRIGEILRSSTTEPALHGSRASNIADSVLRRLDTTGTQRYKDGSDPNHLTHRC
jgi:hypothetical protein